MLSRLALGCSHSMRNGQTVCCLISSCMQSTSSGPTDLKDVDHTKFRFENGKFAAAKSGEVGFI